MLACSFCGSVQSADWWAAPFLLLPVALAVVGLGLLWWATRAAGRARVGGLCLAAAMIVPLPLAVLVAGRTDEAIEVVSDAPPTDAPAWRVDCVTAFQDGPSVGISAQFVDACADATRAERWTAYGLVLLAVGLGAFGTFLLATRSVVQNGVSTLRSAQQNDDNDDGPRRDRQGPSNSAVER